MPGIKASAGTPPECPGQSVPLPLPGALLAAAGNPTACGHVTSISASIFTRLCMCVCVCVSAHTHMCQCPLPLSHTRPPVIDYEWIIQDYPLISKSLTWSHLQRSFFPNKGNLCRCRKFEPDSMGPPCSTLHLLTPGIHAVSPLPWILLWSSRLPTRRKPLYNGRYSQVLPHTMAMWHAGQEKQWREVKKNKMILKQ